MKEWTEFKKELPKEGSSVLVLVIEQLHMGNTFKTFLLERFWEHQYKNALLSDKDDYAFWKDARWWTIVNIPKSPFVEPLQCQKDYRESEYRYDSLEVKK